MILNPIAVLLASAHWYWAIVAVSEAQPLDLHRFDGHELYRSVSKVSRFGSSIPIAQPFLFNILINLLCVNFFNQGMKACASEIIHCIKGLVRVDIAGTNTDCC